ncbi:MAG TPA: DUF4307 domain-containing protein [Mycobacteriales bacterium]|nr:DUF4307 domain-containing protein [Mycobacteriales bacterium]
MSASSPPPTAPRGRSAVKAARVMSDEEYRVRAYRRGPRWVLPTLVALVLCAGVGVTVAYYHNFGSKPLDATVTAFHINQRSIDITATITRNHPDRAVSCVLSAQARDHGVIGSTTVRLPAGSKTPSVSRTIHTKTRPYAGEVESCSYITN